ncbi:MAG: YIP1 family protein [Candidatus Margulisbacteria bacterium]|nr:YIP1 family protein [Candidatus Margulisiibacteriota bacterium]
MSIFNRARDIIIHPKETWQVIKDETVSNKDLFVNYAAPLALIPAVASLVSLTLVGIRLPDGAVIRAPFIEAVSGGAIGYALHLIALFLGAWVIKMLAPLFKAKADFNLALKVVVFSMTPVWAVGIFSLAPGLSFLSLLGLYGIYLLSLGLGTILETPSNKVVLYTISVILVSFLISLLLSVLTVGLFYGPMFMRMMAS